MELDSLKYVKDWLEARYIKEYFIDKEQKYGFTKPELIKFIEKIINLTIENTEEDIKNHYKIETILMDLLKKVDKYNKEGKKYKIDLNRLEIKINDISSNKENQV